MASELVEKVAKDMHDFWGPYPEGQEWGGKRLSYTTMDNTRATARAAIKAVAEFLGKVHGHNGCASKLLAQLEDKTL
jgi:hypothetical protein